MAPDLSRAARDRLLGMVPVTAARILAPDGLPPGLEAALLARNPGLAVSERAGDGGHDVALLLGGQDFAARLGEAAAGVGETGVVSFLVPNAQGFAALEGFLRGRARQEDALGRDEILRAAEEANVPLGRLGTVIEDAATAEAAARALQPYLDLAGIAAGDVHGRCAPSFFVGQTRPKQARTSPIRMTGATLGSKPDAMAIVRMNAPLGALNTLPGFAVGSVAPSPAIAPADRQRPKDVFVWQRPIFRRVESLPGYRKVLESHRLLVVEFDDHPMRWPAIEENHYLTFRAAHAVRTSTPVLADILREWNPNVFVSPNQIEALPPFRPVETREGPVRLVFAALNRREDWAPLIGRVNAALRAHGPDRLRVDVVHDRDFFDAVEAEDKRFHPMLAHAQYKALLGASDIAWLPLGDTLFNRCKSDLKFVECASEGVAVVASPVLYENSVRENETGLFARSGGELETALSRLIEDRALRAALVRAAYEEVSSQRLRAHHLAAEAAWYESLVDDHAALEAARRERLRLPSINEWLIRA